MAAYSLTNDANFVQMVILTREVNKVPLTQTEANEIEKYIFREISSTPSLNRPRFRGEYVFSKVDGAIIINTHKNSVGWLKSTIERYKKKALSATDIKNSPRYTAKVKTVVSYDIQTDNLLLLLEAHNFGLQTNGWRIVSSVYKAGSYIITILIDDPGREMLEKNGFKLLLGFSKITFELVGGVKRSETTGEICDDDILSHED